MKKILILCLTALTGALLATDAPKTIIFDGNSLVKAKNAIANGDANYANPLETLKSKADSLISKKIVTVMDKKYAADSGDKHDFLSFGTYCWPNPDTPDGRPFIQKDGVANPNFGDISDSGHLADMQTNTGVLGVAYFYTGDEKYAKKAAQYVRAWFVDPTTMMNPSIENAAIIPGQNNDKGRCYGIIAMSFRMHFLLDGIALIKNSTFWTEEDEVAFRSWLTKYVEWLTTSPLAHESKMSRNNHATYFVSHLAMCHIYLGQLDEAKEVIQEFFDRASSEHFGDKGAQKYELSRTLSFSYSTMNARGWTNLATMGDLCGFDGWNYKNKHNIGIYDALKFFVPYCDSSVKWPYTQIKKRNNGPLWELIVLGAQHYDDKSFDEGLKKLNESLQNDIYNSLFKLYFPYDFNK